MDGLGSSRMLEGQHTFPLTMITDPITIKNIFIPVKLACNNTSQMGTLLENFTKYPHRKKPKGCTIYFRFISIINLYLFRAGLLLNIRRYYSVYKEIGTCHAFMLTGSWQDPSIIISYLFKISLASLLESSIKNNSIRIIIELYSLSQLTTNTTSTPHFSS
jgi:hypothetical protein